MRTDQIINEINETFVNEIDHIIENASDFITDIYGVEIIEGYADIFDHIKTLNKMRREHIDELYHGTVYHSMKRQGKKKGESNG